MTQNEANIDNFDRTPCPTKCAYKFKKKMHSLRSRFLWSWCRVVFLRNRYLNRRTHLVIWKHLNGIIDAFWI